MFVVNVQLDMKWFRLDRVVEYQTSDKPLHIQYLNMLLFCLAEFVFYHASIRWIVHWIKPVTLAQANRLSMAVILSSFGKILLLIMVIWDYGNMDPFFFVNTFVYMSNFGAIRVCLDTGFFQTLLIMLVGISSHVITLLTAARFNPELERILY